MAMMSPNSLGAVSDLGLGDQLAGQVAGETDDERKKRMALMQQSKMLGPSGSLAVTSLFGMRAPGAVS